MNRAKETRIGFAVGGAVLLMVAVVLLFAWFARQADTEHFDSTIRTAVHQLASPGLTRFMRAVSVLGEALVLGAMSVLIVVLLSCLRQIRDALVLAITMLGSLGLDLTLKHVFHRARPVPFVGTAPHSYSFPSGHALASLCFYATFALIVSGHVRRRGIRWILWIITVLLIAAIGLSRIYLGVHYPSDVIGGYCAALFWVAAVNLFRK